MYEIQTIEFQTFISQLFYSGKFEFVIHNFFFPNSLPYSETIYENVIGNYFFTELKLCLLRVIKKTEHHVCLPWDFICWYVSNTNCYEPMSKR